MSGLTLVLACLFAGLALRRSQALPPTAVDTLNAFAIHVSLPALALLKLHELPRIGREILLLASMPWMMFALALAFFRATRSWTGLGARGEIGLALACGLGNTSFVGLPLIEALIGPDALELALVVDQAGTFLALAVLGIPLAARVASRASVGPEGRPAVAKFWRFPPFVAAMAGLALRPLPFPEWLAESLARLGSTLAPVTLVAVGAQLASVGWRPGSELRGIVAGLGWKLALAPAVALAIYSGALGMGGLEGRTLVLQAAMAPMITGAVVAAQMGLEPRLLNLCVAFGIPLSLVTVPLWNRIWNLLT